jgi:hypothetical protein
MNNPLFDKYAEVQSAIKELEAKRDALEILVMEDLKRNQLQKFQHDKGTFSLTERVSYEYDEQTKLKIADKKKEIKAIEEKGKETAVATKVDSLRFQLTK